MPNFSRALDTAGSRRRLSVPHRARNTRPRTVVGIQLNDQAATATGTFPRRTNRGTRRITSAAAFTRYRLLNAANFSRPWLKDSEKEKKKASGTEAEAMKTM